MRDKCFSFPSEAAIEPSYVRTWTHLPLPGHYTHGTLPRNRLRISRNEDWVADLEHANSECRIIIDSILASRKDDVGLSVDALGDLRLISTLNGGGWNEYGASDGDESSIELALAVLGDQGVPLRAQSDRATGDDRVRAGNGQGGERLDRERWVVRGAFDDERGRQRVDFIERERRVEWLWVRELPEASTEVG